MAGGVKERERQRERKRPIKFIGSLYGLGGQELIYWIMSSVPAVTPLKRVAPLSEQSFLDPGEGRTHAPLSLLT